ncbi:metallophosphoesterase family protein [Pseudomonas mosselii]|uniref:metallophosphoesterase family protein n=1 Tax=Pseudomonas mosselii TaxID=78327 RepID=UPI000BB498F6|nr:metallophosphoesterase [Pseudomonas mosselii]ATB65134.1 hypothetical protein CLJ08_11075 [Pseudomonas mosselii]MDH1101761.1 metallophosphoesterase [Pseudomonas mosselii]MEB5931884.1 metallophosphoesterase [Pseudomonas mosselii]UVN44748.1 metallophosphoesterase [Pseudomonas mosselii]
MSTISLLRKVAVILTTLQLAACTSPSPDNTDQTKALTGSSALMVAGCESTPTDDFASYIRPGWQNPSPTLQKIVIASDPQPFRAMTKRNPYEEKVDEAKWKLNLSENWTGTFKLQRQGSYHIPLLVNGDMTDFGHGNERSAMRERMRKMGYENGPLMLPGLGNHDYDQNVGDCANNGCARDAVCDHIKWVSAIKNNGTGVNFDYNYNASSRTHSGSLAYSLDVGNIHIVQLNLQPNYTKNFSSGFPTKTHFNITSSMNWLRSDLQAAKQRGKYTIINMHNMVSDEAEVKALSSLAADNKVVAIFAGHLHGSLGQVRKLGKVPVFQDGALLARSFLTVLFYWDVKVMQVNAFADFNDAGEWKYNIDTLEPPAPPEGSSMEITVYTNANYQGKSCTLTLTVGHTTQLCSDYLLLPVNSMKVRNYSGRTLKLVGPILNYLMINGSFTGDFELPDFNDGHTLPSPLTYHTFLPLRTYVNVESHK